MNSQVFKKIKLPDAPGVYLFRRKEKILYIGKATSLRSRVKSYFAKYLGETRGQLLVEMIKRADRIDFQKTDSVLEALLLEAELIKKHQPRYNTEQKDDKSFNCVVITDEKFPCVLVVRKKDIDSGLIHDSRLRHRASDGQARFMIQDLYGPFTNAGQLKTALKIIRKIFPFRDTCTPLISPFPPLIKEVGESARPEDLNPSSEDGVLPLRKGESRMYSSPCFNRQIGLCPGVCNGEITEKEYQKTIRHIRLFFEGKKKKLLDALSRDMKTEARAERFEKAGEIKKTIFALRHIQDIALLGSNDSSSASMRDVTREHRRFRVEAYDIAHISGTDVVGAMVVVEDGTPNKSEYRKFKIRGGFGNNDLASLKEVIERRLARAEWPMPGIFVADGGLGHRRIIEEALKVKGFSIPVVAVTKDQRHRPEKISGDKEIIRSHEREILLANAEAHRFVIAFHRKRRGFGLAR